MSKVPRKQATANEYMAQARTGDIPLFISDSVEIKCFTGSPYTHVGMVVCLEPHILGGSGVYLWHSMPPSSHGLLDLLSEPPRHKDGPQLNDLADVLDRYKDVPIHIRRIRFTNNTSHPWATGTVESTAALIAFMRKEHGKKYETNVMELVKSAYDGPGGQNIENTDEYFCSELVAETFKQFGIMNTPQPSNEFYPGNFSSSDDYILGVAPFVRFKSELQIVKAV